MAYRTAASRAKSHSPTGVEKCGKGVSLSVNTNLNGNAKLNGEASSFKPTRIFSANQYLLHDSEPLIVSSTPAENLAGGKTNGNGKVHPSPIGTLDGISPTRAKVNFSTDVVPGKFLGSHYVKVELDGRKYDHVFAQLDKAFGWNKKIRSFCVKPDAESKMYTAYAAFDDVHHAAQALEQVTAIESTAEVSYVTQPEFAGAQKDPEFRADSHSHAAPTSFFDGQVMLYARFDGPMTMCKAGDLESKVHDMTQSFGNVLAFGEIDSKNGMARFRAEFTSIKAAKEVLKKLDPANPAAIGSWFVFATELKDITSPANSDRDTGAAGRGTPEGSAGDGSSPTYVSPTGRTAWTVNTEKDGGVWAVDLIDTTRTSPVNGGTVTTRSLRNMPTPPMAPFGLLKHHHAGDRHGSWETKQSASQRMPLQQYAVGHPQQNGHGRNHLADSSQAVVLEFIRRGIDVRTTVMLRNLPNEMTSHRLKELLDESNFGEYDFSYVRIDYGKNASVGYGFVNFEHAEAIIKFLLAWEGHPWMPELVSLHSAARLAAISYATVQGYENCVEKFRNSSVMTECPDYRPKLWYTHSTAPTPELVGTEAPFPPVNNMSKHQRSLANATQIGLFPPQSRRGPAGHYRTGRSQWDRGTTAQQQEDMMFLMQQQMQHMTFAQAASMHPHGNYGVAHGQNYPMQQVMPQQQGSFGGVVACDFYGNPIIANAAPIIPPNGFYPQMQPNLANANGSGHGPRFAGHVRRGGHRAARTAAVPRSFYGPYDADEDPNAFDGDVDVAGMMGYHNPMQGRQD